MKYKIFIIGFFLVFNFTVPFSLFAATAESVNQQISDTNAKIQALDKEIAAYESQIDLTSEQAATLANLIKELNLTRSKLLKETQSTEAKITATTLDIGLLNKNISEEQQKIIDSRKLLGSMFRTLNERDTTGVLYQLVSQTSLIDASHEYNNILSLNKKVREYVVTLNQEVTALGESKNKKQTDQESLTRLSKTLKDKKLAVDAAKAEKDALLTETKNQESEYKKLLADRQKKRDAFEKDLENYEAQLKFILNPNLLPATGSGILSWPLDSVFITQLFGKTVSAKRLYTSGSHSGVDFRATLGTPVKSMAPGMVMGSGDTDVFCKGASFGKWVFIKYDNGLSSTFGHLSVISSQAGQRVATGDVVGLSGNTGHSTGPHLHVTVYASQGANVETVPSLSCNGKVFIMPIAPTSAYLDPMLYLPKISSSQIKSSAAKD